MFNSSHAFFSLSALHMRGLISLFFKISTIAITRWAALLETMMMHSSRYGQWTLYGMWRGSVELGFQIFCINARRSSRRELNCGRSWHWTCNWRKLLQIIRSFSICHCWRSNIFMLFFSMLLHLLSLLAVHVDYIENGTWSVRLFEAIEAASGKEKNACKRGEKCISRNQIVDIEKSPIESAISIFHFSDSLFHIIDFFSFFLHLK